MTPDAQLVERYGTTKEASFALATRIAAAVLGASYLESDRQHVEEQREGHELEDREIRQQEAGKMDATISAMKMAEASGAVMARMEKQAFGAVLGKALTQTLPTAAGKVVGKVPGARKAFETVKPSLKTKALAAGGALATSYAGYKGLSALRDYADKPPTTQTWGSKRPLQHNVSSWGYPMY